MESFTQEKAEYYTFLKIENIKYNSFEVYYKKPVDIYLRKATVFNDNYNYYYKDNDSDKDNESIKLLGYFKRLIKVNLGCPFSDCDYDVYEFDKDKIFCTKKEFIYCSEIPYSKYNIDYNNEFFIVEEMLYLNLYPIYYKKNVSH